VYDGDPGDEAIIDRALDSDRVLVTGDKDFGEWIFLRSGALITATTEKVRIRYREENA
jgi:predicted nuclease of predicted toxin-antitoxin system